MLDQKENFIERIRNRMDEQEAEKVISFLEHLKKEPAAGNALLKQSAEAVSRYRHQALDAIRHYKGWRKRSVSHPLQKPLHEQEGRILLESARGATALYVDAKRDYHDLKNPNAFRAKFSAPLRAA
jgi:hypothetical protein